MRYDAVFLYIDNEHPHYERYSLPQRQVSNAEREEFRFLCRPIRAVNESYYSSYSSSKPPSDTASTAYTASLSGTNDDSDDDSDDNTDDGNSRCAAGRWIYPVPYSGGNELFIVDITDDEVKSFIDENGDIRFDRVLEWTLPTFVENNEISLF